MHELTIAKQRVRIEELEEACRQLSDALVPPAATFPIEWKLTPAQVRMLAAFLKSPFLTHEKLFLAMALNTESEMDNLVKVQVCKLRQKVGPLGIVIINRWGLGYEMPEESLAIVRGGLCHGHP